MSPGSGTNAENPSSSRGRLRWYPLHPLSSPLASSGTQRLRERAIQHRRSLVMPPDPAVLLNNSLTANSGLTKALMLNTARAPELEPARMTHYPRTIREWVKAAQQLFDVRTQLILRDEVPAEKFTSGQQRVITGFVPITQTISRNSAGPRRPPDQPPAMRLSTTLDLRLQWVATTRTKTCSVAHLPLLAVRRILATTLRASSFRPASQARCHQGKGTNIAGNGVPGDADLDDYSLVALTGPKHHYQS